MERQQQKIYVIEADSGTGSDLIRRIGGMGYAIAGTSRNMNEALLDRSIRNADIILLDIDMQMHEQPVGDDNVDTNRFITPVVYIASIGDDSLIERCLVTEPYGIITKPLNDTIIRATLDIALKRWRLENHLIVSEMKYRGIFEDSKDAIFITDSNGFIVDYNIAMAELFGYDDGEMMKVVLNDLYYNLDEVVKQYGLYEQRGYIKDMEVSLKRKSGERIYGLLSSSFLQEGDHGVKFFQNIIKEITPLKQRADSQMQLSNRMLNDMLRGSIEAMSMAVEARDPFTAGHQREVSYLAVDIARQMGLDENTIEGLRIAALIHDFGKISIPSEILMKPGPLTDIERRMVREHPGVGYAILKSINFPWPVAEFVRQHHERMNGSGYPDGSSGDEICLEARILSIADVIDAMSSHRPYRPSRGLREALDEINRGKGELYDPDVADACMAMFNARMSGHDGACSGGRYDGQYLETGGME